jgi:hypothetical protein
MKRIIFIFSIILLLSTYAKAQEGFRDGLMQKQAFYEANLELEAMLNGDARLDYERAVFVMENAYRGNTIDYAVYEEVLDFHTQNIRLLAEANRDSVLEGLPDVMFETEEQKQERYDMLLNNWAIYHYMTDTTIIRDGEFEYVHMPYRYSYSDPMGVLDWKHTQVMNLLDNKAGNCYAMVNLYMIFAKRLGTDARIGVAPGHVFVMHDGMDGREYFVELSNGSFPGTGTIMTLSYSPLEAVKEGISMRALSEEQAVSMCLVYLGKAYEQKFDTKTDGFIYGCAETALEHDSLNLNAMLLKTEVLEERLWSRGKSMDQLQNSGEFREYEALVAELYNKGYREMPQDMKNLIIRGLQKDDGGIVLKDHTPRAFQTIDDEGERYATLSWGLFDEVHEPKDVERYGRALFDTKTRKIIALSEVDSLYNHYPMDIGVFAMAVDPLTSSYPWNSPYAFAENDVVRSIDLEGAEKLIVNNAQYTVGVALLRVYATDKGKQKLDAITKGSYQMNLRHTYYIKYDFFGKNEFSHKSHTLNYAGWTMNKIFELANPSYVIMSHELSHLYDMLLNHFNSKTKFGSVHDDPVRRKSETNAVIAENYTRSVYGYETMRDEYDGLAMPTNIIKNGESIRNFQETSYDTYKKYGIIGVSYEKSRNGGDYEKYYSIMWYDKENSAHFKEFSSEDAMKEYIENNFGGNNE